MIVRKIGSKIANDHDLGFRRYLASIQQFPILDRAEEQVLARRWRDDGDRAAADTLVQSHLRFVVKIALSYRGYGLRIADLVEEGNVGLLEAVRRFDPERNLRFMTYAAYWIRAFMLTYVLKHWSIVGMGTGPIQSRLFFRLQRERNRLTQADAGEHVGESFDGALAKTFETSEDRIRAMSGRLDGRDSSLDTPIYKDGEATMLDFIAAGESSQEDRFASAERDQRVRTCLARLDGDLDARERVILEERLLGDDDTTLADLGRRLGLSRERVRQLEERLKKKLRRALEPAAQAA